MVVEDHQVGGLGDSPHGVSVSRSTSGVVFYQPVTPRAVERLTLYQQELLADLQRTSLHLDQIRQNLDASAADCRFAGISWNLIGWSVGLTAEGARLRWADRS